MLAWKQNNKNIISMTTTNAFNVNIWNNQFRADIANCINTSTSFTKTNKASSRNCDDRNSTGKSYDTNQANTQYWYAIRMNILSGTARKITVRFRFFRFWYSKCVHGFIRFYTKKGTCRLSRFLLMPYELSISNPTSQCHMNDWLSYGHCKNGRWPSCDEWMRLTC